MTPLAILSLLFFSALCLIYAYFVFTTPPAQLSKTTNGSYGLPAVPQASGPVYVYNQS